MTADDIDTGTGGTLWRWLGLIAAIFATIMAVGMVAGFTAASAGHGFSLLDGAILGALLMLALGLALLVYRLARPLVGNGAQVPTRERRSRNILIGSSLLGGITGMVIAIVGLSGEDNSAFALLSNGPVHPAVAIGMAFVILFVLPLISWQWHRTIDEHERDAYRSGAVAGAYFFMIGAPVWWLLWRGGLAPRPDGIILYFVFDFVFLAVWLWKKYR